MNHKLTTQIFVHIINLEFNYLFLNRFHEWNKLNNQASISFFRPLEVCKQDLATKIPPSGIVDLDYNPQ